MAAVLATTACSASQSRSDAGQIQTDAAAADLTVPPADSADSDDAIPAGFVTGDVDGVTIRADMGAAAYLQAGFIDAVAHTSEWTWGVSVLNDTGARAGCGGGGVFLVSITGTTMDAVTSNIDGVCMDEVTHPAPNVGDWLDGTFSATLVTTDGKTNKIVTNGAFHVPRLANQ